MTVVRRTKRRAYSNLSNRVICHLCLLEAFEEEGGEKVHILPKRLATVPGQDHLALNRKDQLDR